MMEHIDVIISGVAAFLLITGYLMILKGRSVSASRQHQFAFAAIILLIIGVFPQLSLPLVAPGIVLSLAMMLFSLHLSAYYSGTPKNSARMYAVLLFLTVFMLMQLAHPLFMEISFGRFILTGMVWVIMLQFEGIISSTTHRSTNMENSFLWLWILSGAGSLIVKEIQVLPDMFFLFLLLTHLEKRWRLRYVPAPVVALYGIIFSWHFHLSASVYFTDPQPLGTSLYHVTTVGLVVLLILIHSYRQLSMTKTFLYLFIAQDVLITGLHVDNLFIASGELFGLLRLLLFISLIGILVMIESNEGERIDSQLISGIFHERPRFTTAFMIVTVFLVLYPLVYLSSGNQVTDILLGMIVMVGLYWLILVVRLSFQKVNRPYRILRPSLSIWSTVVFVILWSAVAILETIV